MNWRKKALISIVAVVVGLVILSQIPAQQSDSITSESNTNTVNTDVSKSNTNTVNADNLEKKELFEIKLIDCRSDDLGFAEVDFSIKNNDVKDHILNVSFLQQNADGDVVKSTNKAVHTFAGRTIYDSALDEVSSQFKSCNININQVMN